MLAGDTVTVSGGTANFANKNVGTGKPVTATGFALGGADGGNYMLSPNSATATASITPRTLTVTATGIDKVYNGTTTATVTLSDNRVAGDVLTVVYASASFADPNAGNNKPVSVSGIAITGGADQGNYALGNVTASTTANITRALTTLLITSDAPDPTNEGAPYTVTWIVAVISPGAGVPTGMVTVNDGTSSCLPTAVIVGSCVLTSADNGAKTLTAAYLGDGNFYGSANTAPHQVLNVAPVISNVAVIGGPAGPLPVGSSVTIQADFTDAGAGDTHTCSISWDDGGANSIGAVIETNGSGTCTSPHIYNQAGVYTVTVTVTDDDGGADAKTFEFVVIYDPNAGFVTGGGWIVSPLGAYIADPTLSGKATFGFVSKYQKGAKVPSGNTEFQFHAAKFNFKSTSYDWLVIAGAKAQYKGIGTVGGDGQLRVPSHGDRRSG